MADELEYHQLAWYGRDDFEKSHEFLYDDRYIVGLHTEWKGISAFECGMIVGSDPNGLYDPLGDVWLPAAGPLLRGIAIDEWHASREVLHGVWQG